jgi:hypothetical protein
MEDLAKQGILFGGTLDPISNPGCFTTKLVSAIEKQMQNDEEENPFSKINEKLQEIGLFLWSATSKRTRPKQIKHFYSIYMNDLTNSKF